MDFYNSRVLKVGGFYFSFEDDSRRILELQSHSKIGRGRLVNVISLDESGASYKQYSKNGCFDSDYDSVVNDINFRLSKRSKQKTKFILAIIFFIISGISIFTTIINSFIFGIADAFKMMFGEGGGIFFLTVTTLGLLLYFSSTKIRKPYLLFDITPKKEKTLQDFFDELLKIDESEKIWIVKTVDRHNDAKRNAGATAGVSRNEVYFNESFVKDIISNVCIPKIGKLYFLPDVILYSNQNEITPIFYDKMEIQLSTKHFREEEKIPSDSEEIGSTWLYVNKDGSPDRRFGENRKIPIMKYCGIIINSDDGLSITIMTSNYEIGKAFANTLHNYKLKARR